MFKNRFFTGNNKWNRMMIKNLNDLSKQSQRLQQMKKKIQQMETKFKSFKDQTKTNDGSETSSTTKTISSGQDWKHNVSIQHLRFYSFLQSTVGTFHLSNQEMNQYNTPKFSLEFIPHQQRQLILSQAHEIIKQVLQKNSKFFNDFKYKKMSNRLKLFFIFRKIEVSLKEKKIKNQNLVKVCHWIIFEMFRDQLIKNSQRMLLYKKISKKKNVDRTAKQQFLSMNDFKECSDDPTQID